MRQQKEDEMKNNIWKKKTSKSSLYGLLNSEKEDVMRI